MPGAVVGARVCWRANVWGVSPLRGAGLLRCASSRIQRPSVSTLAGGHPSRNTARPAMPAGMTTAARSRARGSRALLPSRIRERGPLGELTGLQVAALRSLRRRSDRHPGHAPSPEPGR